jgi:ubiquitin-conjugating enzyme E2 A
MSTLAKRRLIRDLKKVNEEEDGFTATPLENNIMYWEAILYGPQSTIWDGACFRITLEFGEDYPNKPPVVKFKTNIFHPNVYGDGSICLDILQN